jgi:hypothetical protein
MYKSPFKRVKCSDAGKKKIAQIQDGFDALYRGLHHAVGLKPTKELQEAIKLMKHACMLYTRACAEQHDLDNPFKWVDKK